MMQRYLYLLLDVAFRRRRTVLRIALLVFGIILLLSVAWPPIYESSAKILVQDNRAQFLVSPTLPSASGNQPAVMVSPVSEQELNSELTLLSNRGLIEQTLADMPTPRPAASILARALAPLMDVTNLPGWAYRLAHSGPVPTDRQRWALALEHNLSPWVIKRSDLIEVDFRSHDPVWAQRFLTALLAHYLDFHAQLSHDPQAEHFFTIQANLLQHKLDLAEEHLRAIELQTGISNLPQQKHDLLAGVASFEAELAHNREELAGAQEQVLALAGQLQAMPERLVKETKIVQNMALQTIKPMVLQLETQRADLLTRYRPDSQRVRDIDAKLKAAQAILARENHTEMQEKSTDVNPAWEALEAQYAQTKVRLDTLKATQAELQKEILRDQNQLKGMTGDEIAIEEAMREVDVTREAYLSYTRKSEEARASGALNRSKILNVSVAETPMMPLRPVFPNLPVNMAVAAVLATVLGLGAAWWEEQRDARLYSIDAIHRASGLSTVAVLPEGF